MVHFRGAHQSNGGHLGLIGPNRYINELMNASDYYYRVFYDVLSDTTSVFRDHGGRILERPLNLLSQGSTYLIAIASDVVLILRRCLFAPAFDPYTLKFLDQLTELEAKAEDLGERLVQINTQCHANYDIAAFLQLVTQYHYDLELSLNTAYAYEQGTCRAANLTNLHNTRVAPLHQRFVRIRRSFEIAMRENNHRAMTMFESYVTKIWSFGVKIPAKDARELRQMAWAFNAVYEANIIADGSGTWFFSKGRDLFQKIDELEYGRDGSSVDNRDPNAPPRFYNLGNSCYFDATVQALLADDAIRAIIAQPLARKEKVLAGGTVKRESDEKYFRRENLRRELSYIIQPANPSVDAPTVSLNQIAIWMDQSRGAAKPVITEAADTSKPRTPDLKRLRDAIFAAKRPKHVDLRDRHVPDFVAEVNLDRQFDASQVIELFMDALLPYRFKHESLLSPTDLPGLQFYKATPENQTTLQIPLHPPKSIQDWMVETGRRSEEQRNVPSTEADQSAYREYVTQQSQLVEQIRLYSRGQIMPQARFNPQARMEEDRMEARVVDPEIGHASQNLGETLSPYLEQNFLRDLPEMLPIHLKRFTNNGSLLNPVSRRVGMGIMMPNNGIVDLTEFLALDQRQEDQPALYRIVSYIEHIPPFGSDTIEGGHYVTYANKNGTYWRLDDGYAGNQQVTENEFFNHRNPYLIILKKLTPDEVVAYRAQ